MFSSDEIFKFLLFTSRCIALVLCPLTTALLINCTSKKKTAAVATPVATMSGSSDQAAKAQAAVIEGGAKSNAAPVAVAKVQTVIAEKPLVDAKGDEAAAADKPSPADEAKIAANEDAKDKKDDADAAKSAAQSAMPGGGAGADAKGDDDKPTKSKKDVAVDKDKANVSKKENKSEIKPKKIVLDAKAKHIAESKEKRGKGDYPTMDDVLSDWDSEKDGAKEGGKAKPKVSKEKTKTKDATNLDDEKEEGGKDAK